MLILDSNILIYSLQREYQYMRDYFQGKEFFCSIMSKVEVLGYHKLSSQEKTAFEILFSKINLIPVTEEIVERSIHLKQIQKLTLGDALIAATALEFDAELVTANKKDFQWIKNL